LPIVLATWSCCKARIKEPSTIAPDNMVSG
jgi:hypothetical protein